MVENGSTDFHGIVRIIMLIGIKLSSVDGYSIILALKSVFSSCLIFEIFFKKANKLTTAHKYRDP
jgi:hypothetical protein